MKRKILTLIVLVMLLCLPLKAPAEEHTFAAGSFIIPMDSFYQPEADGGVLEAYGLVYYLLNHKDTNGEHDITVYWVINQTKTAIDGIDLEIEVDAATLEDLNKESVVKLYNSADGTTSVLSQYKTYDGGDDDSNVRVSYSGGVFIVEAEDVANAKAIINPSDWLKVEVHEAQVPFSAPVFREMIGTPPKIALMNNDEDKTKGNAQILEAYLRLAGLCTDTYEVVTPNEIRDGKLRTAGYDFLWAPHWTGYDKHDADGNGNGTPDVEDIVTEIKLFLESGKGMLAECASIETFEHSENGHFLSTKGFGHNQGTNDETRVIYNDVTGPNVQVGDFEYDPEGGHLHNWRPYHSGDNYNFDVSPDVTGGDSAYVTAVTRFTVDDTNDNSAVDDTDWDYYVGGYAYGDTNNGYVVYLGGHKYASCEGSIAVEPQINVKPLDFEFKKDVDKSDKVYTITFAVAYNDGADKSSGVTFTTDADFSDPALSIRSASYAWQPSGSGTGEYYLTTSAGDVTGIYQPSVLTANDFAMTAGTAGSLAAGKWAWADNDSLGYQTVYVRLADSTDPDTKAAAYLEAEYVGDPLEIDLTTASVKRKKLLGVTLRNNGSSDITVNAIGLLWSGGGGDAGEQRIKKITDTTTDVRLYDGEANTPFGLATAGFAIPALATTSAGCTDNDDCDWKNIAGVRYVLNTLFNIKYQIQSREYARSAPIVKHPWLYQGSFEYPSYFGHFRRYDVTMTAAEMDADWDTADAGHIADANDYNDNGRKVYTAELSAGTWTPIPFDETKLLDLDDLLDVTPGGDTNDELAVITRVRGKYWNSDNSQWVERANKLGGIMHSAPAIVDHNSRTGSRDEVAYVGDLYGMLHAIETASGNEKWAFIPRNLLGKLKNDRTDPNATQDFAAVDGSPAVKDVYYDHDGNQGTADQWRTILVSTEGRGGNYVFALDVTDPDNWSVLWELTVEAILSYAGSGGFSPGDTVTGETSGATGEVVADDTENGELSLEATVGSFQNGETVFEDLDNDGTLDPNEDSVTVTQKVEMGHAYRASVNRVKWPVKDHKGDITGYEQKLVVYVATGYLNIAEDHGGINVFAFDLTTGDKLWHFSDQYVDAVNDIPGAVTLFDTTGDQFVDRVYVGDMNGRLWELDAMDGTNPHGTEDVEGVTKQIPLWNAGVGNPISVSPAIIRDSGHVVLIFGSGGADWAADDQAYSIYAVDATELKETPTYAEGAGTLLWEQTLDEGEKVRSTPTIAAGRIYVATASGTMESTDPGEDVAGSGYLYSLDLKTGDKAWTSDDNPEGRVDVGKGLSSVYVDRRHVYLTTINNEIRQIGDDDFTAGQANNVLLKAWREVW